MKKQKRVRHTLPMGEVAHAWAHQTQDYAQGSGGTFYFRGDTIYSYGTHFPIARLIKRPGKPLSVLFTYRFYSQSTSGHTRLAADAVSHMNKIPCFDPSSHVFDEHELTRWAEQMGDIYARLRKARKPEIHLSELEARRTQAVKYLQFWGKRIPAAFDPAKYIEVLRKDYDRKAYHDAHAEEIRAKLIKKGATLLPGYLAAYEAGTENEFRTTLKGDEEKALKEFSVTPEFTAAFMPYRVRRDEKFLVRGRVVAAKLLRAWKRGDKFQTKAKEALSPFDEQALREYQRKDNNATTLRFNRKEQQVETSKGYRIPKDVALRFYHSIQKQGKALIGTKFMEFNIDGLNGSLKIGCHNIPMTEVMEMGKMLESLA